MENKNYKNGLIYALSCAVIWGFLPIYWNALKPISSLVVIFYRIALMTLTCFALQLYQTKNIKEIFAPMFADKKNYPQTHHKRAGELSQWKEIRRMPILRNGLNISTTTAAMKIGRSI